MPISFTIDRTRRQVQTSVVGSISVDDIVGHYEATRREGTLVFSELIDTREIVPPFLSTSDIWKVAKAAQVAFGHQELGPRVIVVKNDLAFGLTRMFVLLISDNFRVEVVKDMRRAEELMASWSLKTDAT